VRNALISRRIGQAESSCEHVNEPSSEHVNEPSCEHVNEPSCEHVNEPSGFTIYRAYDKLSSCYDLIGLRWLF
jgi:hypothetical protein